MTVTSVSSDDLDQHRPLLFHKNCEIIFSNEPTVHAAPTVAPRAILRLDSAGIGGLSDHITTINRTLATISSTSFPRSNSSARGPTSFLLHGPEGCGKSLLLKRLSEASWRKVYRLDETWLAANRKEQSAALSEDIFEAALKHQPSLILIDNLDKFVQKAETLVDQMQDELDKLRNTKVVVAAAARTIYDIDARLRSQKGLRIELEVFPPNVKQREDILRQLVAPQIERGNIDWALLAEKCHGFVGRDIENLIMLARYHRDDQILDSLGEDAKDTINEALEKVDFVAQEDFDAVIGQIQPSVLKDSIIEVPKVSWEDIAGVGHVRSLLESIVVRPYKVSHHHGIRLLLE
jgi:AAA family ATPase